MSKKKVCYKCKDMLLYNMFNNDKRSKDRLQAKCKSCIRHYYLKNKERKKEYDRNPENKIKKAERDKSYYLKNKDKVDLYRKEYYNNNKESLLSYKKEYYKLNKEILASLSRQYYKDNRDIIIKKVSKFNKLNTGMTNARGSRYRSKKLKATPEWLTKEHLSDILQIYQDVQDIQWLSEELLQVDHIIPLQGKNVCGLHVPWNLQILTKSENCRKGNRF